ncbi:MAG: GNAT family N-acetyltransferase [Kangiellaceae bacterium]|nr:GNAT family N-acetyltransferase [Kangiellaceae bacterium]
MNNTTQTTSVPVIETERLILRQFKLDDFEIYAQMMADPDIVRYLSGGEPMTRHQAWRSLATMAGHWVLHGHGQWALEEKDTGSFVGRAGLFNPEGWPDLEAGWVLSKGAQGKGYATEAGKAAIEFAFEHLKANKVISLIQPDNTPSIKVAERIGETYESEIELFGKHALVYSIYK